ncbi:amidohydrolase [Cloacibacillus sp.]|uniref:amidohydrolase n=1 Tax=Cloacibacillus sp. TaxID=2049023 RepID=UPI0025BADB75|nr:amidohydrolase [Cloacibacillus sp.]MCC8057420.1 amidohydrolase [Cloacibacillus sp.]
MELRQMIAELDKNIAVNTPAMAAMSDGFAARPEVSGKEFETSKEIVRVLKEAGFEVEYPALGIPTAFTARCGRGGGPKVAILTEYDALPEIGHACGHNLHGSMSVLTALALLPILKNTDCELLVAGTPAEETDGAKVEMSAKGLFDGCDFAMMIHSCGGKNMVEYRSLAMDAVEFTFTGKTSHAASAPWEGCNALNGLQLFFHAVDMLRQHVRPEVRMHGIVHDGGAAPNIVPERAVGRFYFRAPKRAYLDEIIKKVHNCARGAALATETEVTWRNFEASFMDMLPNGPAETMAKKYFAKIGLEVTPCGTFMGSSDMGDVSYRCPALQPEIDISGENIEAHTRAFAEATQKPRAHEAMRDGAKIIGRCLLEVISDGELRGRMWQSYKEEIAAAKR